MRQLERGDSRSKSSGGSINFGEDNASQVSSSANSAASSPSKKELLKQDKDKKDKKDKKKSFSFK